MNNVIEFQSRFGVCRAHINRDTGNLSFVFMTKGGKRFQSVKHGIRFSLDEALVWARRLKNGSLQLDDGTPVIIKPEPPEDPTDPASAPEQDPLKEAIEGAPAKQDPDQYKLFESHPERSDHPSDPPWDDREPEPNSMQEASAGASHAAG